MTQINLRSIASVVGLGCRSTRVVGITRKSKGTTNGWNVRTRACGGTSANQGHLGRYRYHPSLRCQHSHGVGLTRIRSTVYSRTMGMNAGRNGGDPFVATGRPRRRYYAELQIMSFDGPEDAFPSSL